MLRITDECSKSATTAANASQGTPPAESAA
jgi:hypothetical protein